MSSPLDLLLALGEWALPAVWLPVLVWTALGAIVEASLRVRSGHPLLTLGVRRSLLWALPVGVLAAVSLPHLLPPVAMGRVAAFRPQAIQEIVLPTLEIGVAPAAGETAASLPLLPLVAGVALLPLVALALVRLAAVGTGLVRLRQLAAGEADDGVQRETAAAARAAGVTREVRAVSTPIPTVPFTFGWRRPVVVVPEALAEDADALRLVLAHEVAHVARGDFAAGVAERVLGALFGWHPLVGTIARRIDLDRERAADAAVLAGHPARRRDYASLLLSFSRLPSPALALGAAPGSESLTTRITDMQSSPLSADRLRQLGRSARLLGLGLFVLAVGAASILAIGPSQTRTLLAAEADDLVIHQPVVSIDGVEVFTGNGTLNGTRSAIVTVAVGGWGRFMVSDQPFEGAEPAGSFDLDLISVATGGHTLDIALGAAPFAEQRERRAYARFDAFPDAAPLAAGDDRIGDVWFSISPRDHEPMPVLATYRDRMLVDDRASARAPRTSDAVVSPIATLSGQIFDAETDAPIPGVSLQVEGTSIGAATDDEGRFVIEGVEPGDDVRIRISHPGYESITWVPRNATLTIALVPKGAEMIPNDTEVGRLGENAPDVFEVVETPPQLIGGLEGLMNRIVYPPVARQAGIQGTVYVQFVVDEEGQPTAIECKRSPDEILCAEARRAVSETRFTPGRQRGETVKVRFVLPVKFALPDEEE
ncbi:MAG TPA: TonB family protein [Bacteroidetes bacterium]|nr:TonB family protein [Bacteroidota bacterium]